MATFYYPHYTAVHVELRYEHSDGSRRSFSLALTPENTTDATRESLVRAVDGAMELVQLTRKAQEQA